MGLADQQEIHKETPDLNDILDQMDLKDIYRIFHPASLEYMLLISPWNFL
jgi:hypothetical protein